MLLSDWVLTSSEMVLVRICDSVGENRQKKTPKNLKADPSIQKKCIDVILILVS